MNKQLYKELSQSNDGTYLSIYIPTQVTGDYQINRINFKNAIDQARTKIESHLPDINPFKYLYAAEKALESPDFWANQSTTLGYFSDGNTSRFAHLPTSTKGIVHLGDQYITYPFSQVMNERQRYFVLYLDLNGVKLFEGNAYSITPVIISDVAPTKLSDIKMMYEENTGLQHNPKSTEYHSHMDNEKEKYRDEFFRTLDKGLMTFLHDEDCPMILVGLTDNAQHYRSISNYSNIISGVLAGQWDPLKPDDLQIRTWDIIRSHVKEQSIDQSTLGRLDAQELVLRELSGIRTKLGNGQIDKLIFPSINHPSLRAMKPSDIEKLCRQAEETSADITWNRPETDQIIGILRYKS
jgi:hypothetical protein